MVISVEELSDREEIRQAMYHFFRAADRRDRELARSVFWDDGHLESVPSGEPEQFFMPSLLGKEEAERFERSFEITDHYMMNMVIRLEGDVAFTETYAIAFHILRPDRDAIVAMAGEARFAELGGDASRRYELWVGTRYNTRFEKRDGVWKIHIHRYIIDWTRFVPHEGITDGDGVRSFLRLSGARGAQDRSYEWLPGASNT